MLLIAVFVYFLARADVENYKKECAERDRLSLEFRRKEANIQRLEDEAKCQRQREIDESNKLLDDAAWVDVQEYIKDCQKRTRLSLAFRAREKRKHAKWEQRDAERRLAQQSKDCRDRGLDRRHQEMARRQERARIALDAIRHANCTFSTNPFGHLM
jgi:signal transduction histidine kinase